MSARADTYELMAQIHRRTGVALSFDDCNTLRRAELTLQSWSEAECGDGNDYASWSIERDEQTGIPYRCRYPHQGKMTKYRIPDREAGALRRIKEVCARNGLHFYHQGDPRGCALYVSNEPLTDSAYNRGVACCC